MSFSQTPNMAGARANPAGSPGMGSGNVPFAPGVMSGQLGTSGSGQAPLARQMSGPTVINIGGQQGPPPSNQPGQVPQAQPQASAMAGPMMAEMYVQFLNAYMQALLSDTGKPIVGGVY